MEPEHGIKPVEQSPELDDVLRLSGLDAQSGKKPSQPQDLVFDLRVRATQRRRRVRPAERPAHQGNEKLLVGSLMGKELALEPVQQGKHRGERDVMRGQCVGRGPDLLDQRQDGVVLGPQPQGGGDITGRHGDRVDHSWQHGAKGEADSQHVDDLLHDGARRRREESDRGNDHRGQRQPHADQHGLQGDGLRTTGDQYRVSQGVDPINSEYDVGGLRGRCRPACGKRHPHPGRCERGSVVDPVADHDRRNRRRLALDRRKLVCRVAVGQHRVDAHDAPDHGGDVGAIARDQDDASDPGTAHRADHPGRIGPDRILQQEDAGRLAVDGDEDGQRAIQIGPAPHLAHPRRSSVADDPSSFTQLHPVACDCSFQAVAMDLLDVLGHFQDKPSTDASGDDGAGQDVGRDLVEGRGEPQHLVGIHLVGRGDHVSQNGMPLGERARLVEQHDATVGEPFEGAAALDHHADMSCAGEPGHDRDRSRQQQRARRSDDEHGDGADGVPAEHP